ncbi:flippase [Enterovibrio calviensis]|uniref:flippase n=1 Tax=Enterovibrio calviensis TaxID=91359 RepID=UPI000487C984|nr:flippase [Enterovibrio calviensis]
MLRNISWYGLDKISKVVSILLTSVVASKTLGVEGYGEYSFYIAINTILLPIALLGLDDYCYQKLVSRKKGRTDIIIGNVLSIRLIANLFILACTFLFIYTCDSYNSGMVLILVTSNFFSMLSIYQILNNAISKNRINAFCSSLCTFLFVLVKVYIFYNEEYINIFSMVIVYSVEVSFSLILTVLFVGIKPKFRFDQKVVKILVIKSLPMTISSLAIVVYYKMDQVMLGLMRDYTQVSMYSIQSQVLMAVNLLIQVLINGSYPKWINNNKLNYGYIEALSRVLVGLSILMWISIYIFMGFIVDILWGNEYYDVRNLLLITVVGTLFSGLGAIGSKILTFENLQVYRMKRVVIAMIINLLLNIMLIPSYGYYGAAVATVASQFYSGVVGNIWSEKTRWIAVKQINYFKICNFRDLKVLFRV